jgi:uncharacterized protein (TIGR01619 family)
MTDTPEQTASSDDDHWEIYVTYIDDKPAVVLVDLGVHETAPLPERGALVWLWVFIRTPDEEGFPLEDEDLTLNEIEDTVTDAASKTNSKYVGRITSDGRREFYFYTDDPQLLREILATAMASAPEYRFEVDDAEDEPWSHYRDVLYPSPEDFQQIYNQHVINRLHQAGDPLSVPRPIDHFVNFKTEQDRDAFTAAAAVAGFEAVSRPERNAEEDCPFSLGLLRVDAADGETIDRITFELFDLAKAHDGEYEGWTSKVVKA